MHNLSDTGDVALEDPKFFSKSKFGGDATMVEAALQRS